MKREQLTTALALQYLNCDSLESMDQRILIQKKFYLAKSLGAKFGYHFSWYLRGPYSKELTSVAYEVIPQGGEELEGYRLTSEAKSILDHVNSLSEGKPVTMSEASWFELLASIVYLRDEYSISGLKDEDAVVQKLVALKPWYKPGDIRKAWHVCQGITNAAATALQ